MILKVSILRYLLNVSYAYLKKSFRKGKKINQVMAFRFAIGGTKEAFLTVEQEGDLKKVVLLKLFIL